MQTPITFLVGSFLSECDISERSRIEYRKIIDYWYRWLSSNSIDPHQFSKQDFWQYKRHTQTHLKERTVNIYLIILKKYINWLNENKHTDVRIEGIRLPKIKKTFTKEPLTPAEVNRLLNFKEKTLKDRRDKMLIRLLLATGLRLTEALNVRVSDIQRKRRRHYLIVQGKGQLKPIEFGIPDVTYQALQQWIEEAKLRKDHYLIFSTADRKRPMTMSAGSSVIKNRMRRVGITSETKSAHSLRHTFAVTLLKEGISIYDVKAALRHSNLSTTEIYVRDYNSYIINNGKFLSKIGHLVSSPDYKVFY